MADVFISYKREDRAHAQKIAELLSGNHEVFFDADIPVGDSWDQYIERELLRASAVIVLWSARSVLSRWVRLEARHALQRGILVPVLLEPCEVPLEFQDIQAAVLTQDDNAEWEKLAKRVRLLCGAVSTGGPQQIFPTTPPSPRVPDADTYTTYLNYGCSLCDSLSQLLVGDPEPELLAQADRMFSQLKRAIGMISGAADSQDEQMLENVRESVWEAARLVGRVGNASGVKKLVEAREYLDEAATDICWLLGYRSRFDFSGDG